MSRDASHLPAEWSQPFPGVSEEDSVEQHLKRVGEVRTMTDQLPLTVVVADIGGWIVSPFLLRQSS